VFIFTMVADHIECVSSLANGLLAGLVSITAGCDASNPYWSIAIGCIGGLTFSGSIRLMKYLGVDDPLDAFSVHGACGLWGCIASGLVRWLVQGDEIKVLSGCILGAIVIIGWVSICCPIMFFAIKSIGWLRVSPEVEDRGLDEVYHGGLG